MGRGYACPDQELIAGPACRRAPWAADPQRARRAVSVCRWIVCTAMRHGIRASKIKSRARYRRQSFCHFQSPAHKLCARPTKKAPLATFCRFSALWPHKYLYLCPIRQPWRNAQKFGFADLTDPGRVLYHSGCRQGNGPGEQRRKAGNTQ